MTKTAKISRAGAAFGACLLCSLFCVLHAYGQQSAGGLEHFEKHVRPILAENCYQCHGPEKQKANLRLDHISTMLQGGDNGPALVRGNPGASRFIEAISYTNIDLQMPPRGKLDDAAINKLKEWVAAGAAWPDEPVPSAEHTEEFFDLAARRDNHWAWQPLSNATPPAVADSSWPRNTIDRFILARLEEAGLEPAPETNRETLVRRLHFDLTGLPPKPEDVIDFQGSVSANSYEDIVDRLLDSPQFGEHWGRHWLDLTRYAETYGHEQDFPIAYAWRYRDYVIRAFNADVPYDQLVREHIAGDLLPKPRRNPEHGFNESIVATGFWHMHQAQHAPVDVLLDHADRVDNQIDVMSKTFLAMTVSCARCHDHKFDAISTKDYYALAGILESSRRQIAYLDPNGAIAKTEAQLAAIREHAKQVVDDAAVQFPTGTADVGTYVQSALAPCEHGAESSTDCDDDKLARWIDYLNPEPGDEEQPVVREPAPEDKGQVFEAFDHGYGDWDISGPAFGKGPAEAADWFLTEDERLQLTPSGVAHSGRLSPAFRGTLRSPTFTLTSPRIQFLVAGRKAQLRLIIENYSIREHHPLLFKEAYVDVDHGDSFRWVEMAKDVDKYIGCQAYIELSDEGNGYLAVDEIRFSSTPLKESPHQNTAEAWREAAGPNPADVAAHAQAGVERAWRAWRAGEAECADTNLLNELLGRGLISLASGCTEFEAVFAKLADKNANVPDPMPVLAMADGTGQDAPLYVRGNPDNPGDAVPRAFLEAVSGAEQEPMGEDCGRLALANRILDPANPLPARVMVNRVWHYLFGKGIVTSVDNFGELGAEPTHPELLDYLAQQFMNNGWSIKWLIRELVTSSTYRMTSRQVDKNAETQDPANQLFHRMDIRRLPAESVRDNVLATAGTLDTTMFGPSVPAYISPYVGGNRKPKESGPMDGNCRRSIYLEVRRNHLLPLLTAFDFPAPDSTHGKRNTSNVPGQALIVMNAPFVADQAAAWGRQLAEDTAHSIEDKIEAAFLTAFGRYPDETETARATAFFESAAERRGQALSVTHGSAEVWAEFCHALFMTKEFIYIR